MGSAFSSTASIGSTRIPEDGFLKVQGEDITLNGDPILLKGAGLGGWS